MRVIKGVKYRTLKDITSAMYKTPQTDFVMKRGTNTLKEIPDEFKLIISMVGENFYLDNFKLMAIPKYLFLLFYSIKYMETEEINQENPVLNDEFLVNIIKDPLRKTISELYDERDKAIKDLINNPVNLQPCFIWVYEVTHNQEDLIGVYSDTPDRLFKTAMSNNIIYDCSECDNFGNANINTGTIPTFFYDDKNNHYCPMCANEIYRKDQSMRKKILLIGE